MNKKFTISSFRNIILSSLSRIHGINFHALARRMLGESRILYLIFLLFFTLPSSASAEEKIPVFPATPVEAYTVYGSLALFWLAIIFLIIVIKMKLNEIERIQKLGVDKENENVPILD